MSEVIDEKIVLRNLRRNYYTNSALGQNAEADNIETVIETNQTTPAGIAPTGHTDDENANTDEETIENATESGNTENSSAITNIENIPEVLVSNVRFYSLIENTGGINIYVNGTLSASGLKFEEYTNYMPLAPGIYTVSFYAAGEEEQLLAEYKLHTFAGMGSTIAISGTDGAYIVTDISGSAPKCYYNTAYIRLIQLSETSPAMDIYVDGILVITGLSFREVSAYVGVPSGVHSIKAVAVGTAIIIIDEAHNFPSFSVNSIYIITDKSLGIRLSVISDSNSCI